MPGAAQPSSVTAPGAQPPPSIASFEGSYSSPDAALKAVEGWYNSRTRALAARSVELSYAIIGANWAVFGSTGKLLSSPYAKISIGLTVIFLGLNLGLPRLSAHLLRERYSYAESNPARWAQEFQANKGQAVPWPSTEAIDNVARILWEARTWMPLIAGGSLLLGIIRTPL